jgi:hypothetical protein
VPQKRDRTCNQADVSIPAQPSEQDDRDSGFETIEKKRRQCEVFPACAQHVRRADIARAYFPNIAEAGEPGQQQTEWDRAQSVTDSDCCEIPDHDISSNLPWFERAAPGRSSKVPENTVFFFEFLVETLAIEARILMTQRAINTDP